jgi:hypothetical protein
LSKASGSSFSSASHLEIDVDTRTELSETESVKGAEFERRVRKLARSNNSPASFVADKRKGSDGRLSFGGDFTTLKDRKKE